MNLIAKLKAAVKTYDDTHNFTCDLCGCEVFAGEHICAHCNKLLPKNNAHVCPVCGRRVKEPGVCLECKEKPLSTDKARSVCLHEGEAARLVLLFKNGKKYLWRAACELMLPLVEAEFSDCDMIAFVPMTKSRQKKRGYNQSELMAQGIAERTGRELFTALEKMRETQEQKTLSRRAREENLEGCFKIKDRKRVKGKRILIVDDTLTTGATTSELATVFKRAGAERVYAVSLTSVEQQAPFGNLQ